MKKICKILLITIILLIMCNICYKVNAADDMDIWKKGKNWIDTGLTEHNGTVTTTMNNLNNKAKTGFKTIIDFLWGIGLLAAFVTTVIMGIKMMTVPPGEKSRIKQSLTPYIVGIIIIFGALTIWKLLIQILDGSL